MATDIQAQDAHFAAEFSPDVDAEKVGSVYATALFGALDNDLQKISEVLDELMNIRTDEIRPIDALNELIRLQEIASGK